MIVDELRRGIEGGWKAYDASTFTQDQNYEADVAIVGTGAGGGTAAEILSDAGLRVILIEEGPLWTSSDFHMLERESYPNLYQESAGRKTKDKGINILQGRSVGGSTTVNWTTSLRTPSETLAYWRDRFGLRDFEESDLAPWFARMEKRLNVAPWAKPPNANNDVLRKGAARLGIATAVVPRNVKGCWNLGYCGLGCPTNAKQSMLVTTIPAALAKGATLLSRARAWKLETGGATHALKVAAIYEPDGQHLGARVQFVLPSGQIADQPSTWYGGAHIDPKQVAAMERAFFAVYPTITVINVADVLERIENVIDQITLVVRLLAGFSILAGLMILASSIASTRFRRMQEAVVLKTLGATRMRIVRTFSVEFSVLGLLAGAVGIVFANLLTRILLHRLEVDFHFEWAATLGALAGTAMLATATGWIASYRILGLRPLEVLREE